MTLYTSAVIAILFGEPGYLELVDRMLEADMVRIGAPTLAEALASVARDALLHAGQDLTHTDIAPA